jgi:2-oxoisovalerate dehydrogenase E1 component
MASIRALEERCLKLSAEGMIAGSVHVCAGQEAIPVGAVDALTEADRVVATYRGHGWALACGTPMTALLGEICQRSGGVNGGRGGSPYLTATRYRFVGENSIVGAGLPISCGIALSSAVRSEARVVVVSVGDGAMNQGATHEGLVFAAAFSLPLIVICENNGWSEMTPIDTMLRGSIADRVAGYGIDSRVVDGCDPAAVREQMNAAVGQSRAGSGPVFLECRTVRLLGHYNRDVEHYRTKEDRQRAAAEEPIARLRQHLLDAEVLTDTELSQIDTDVAAEIDAATEAVRRMPEPDPATAHRHVTAEVTVERERPVRSGTKTELTYQKAVNAALRTELRERPDVLVYGEDVGRAGGIFGITRGLQEEFGEARVFDTPIAESAILGSAVGAALSGSRPIVEIMWGDFLLVALDQLFNQAANVRYISRGELQAPMVVRTQQGVTPGSCAQHSQSLEAILAHVPGLKVGLPATPHDAYAMLRASVADADPCILFEARSLYQAKGPVWLESKVESVGGARLHREGTDVGIITWGTMLAPALAAAQELADVSAAVLDLRWLRPLDVDAIAELVGAVSGRLLVVHEANVTAGFGAEVAARIQEAHFDELDAPVRRLGAPDVRVPSAPALQRALIPDASAITRACREAAVGASVA